MQIEFDPTKDVANVAKHGRSLARAVELTGIVVIEDTRFSEPRYRLYGTIDGIAHCAAVTMRNGWSVSSIGVVHMRRRCTVMDSDLSAGPFDHDNPEWTIDDVARARLVADFAELAAAFPNGSKPRGRPRGSTTSTKSLISFRLDNDVLERFRATGPGWPSRINDMLAQASALDRGIAAAAIGQGAGARLRAVAA